MGQFETTVTLPVHDLERASVAVRGELRLAATHDDEQVPDWTELVVTEVGSDVDERGPLLVALVGRRQRGPARRSR